MTDLATLVLTAPDPTHGAPVGVGTWRFAVEAILPTHPSSLVGVARVGIDVVSEDTWQDLTPYLTGVKFSDGGNDFGSDTSPTTIDITLNSPDGVFNPWAPFGAVGSGARFVSGLPIRAVWFDPGVEWEPLFTGEVESATPRSIGIDGHQTMHIKAVDPVTSTLTQTQLADYEMDSALAGFANALEDEVTALIDYVSYQYGSVIDIQRDDDDLPYSTAGRTIVNGNVLQVLRRVADILGRQVFADRYGRCAFVRRRPQLVTYSNAYTPATDPNLPTDLGTIDAANLVADTVIPVQAKYAVVNSFAASDLIQPGIFTPATVGEDAVAVRTSVAVMGNTRFGSYAATGESLVEAGILFQYNEVATEDTVSQARWGLRQKVLQQPFPIAFSYFTAGYLADRILELFADGTQLWHIPNIGLDRRHFTLLRTARIGSEIEITKDGATWAGHVSAIDINLTVADDDGAFEITAEMSVDGYTFERAT